VISADEGAEQDRDKSGPHVEVAGGEARLMADGAVQSVAVRPGALPRGYWRALVPERRPADALILGLGGGTVVHLLWSRHGLLPIVGVDNNAATLALGRRSFGLEAPELSIVEADAGEYVRACTRRFGPVVVALFEGEQLPDFVASRQFIRRVRALTRPCGTVVWNLHRDRRSQVLRRRVGTGMVAERRILAGLNFVLHLHRRSRRRRGARSKA